VTKGQYYDFSFYISHLGPDFQAKGLSIIIFYYIYLKLSN